MCKLIKKKGFNSEELTETVNKSIHRKLLFKTVILQNSSTQRVKMTEVTEGEGKTN